MRDLIVEFPEGADLPFKINVKGQFLKMESATDTPLYLKVLNTCYVRCEEEGNYLFSTDLQVWKGFSEFFAGELKVSVAIENGTPVAGLQLDLNRKI